MRRRALLVVVLAALLGCVHDWSLPLAAGDADAGDVADAAADGVASDAGAAFCEGALLCDQFAGTTLGVTWDDVVASPGGRAAIEAFAGAPSPPNVLVAERPSNDDTSSTAYVSKVLSQPLSRVRLALAISPDQLDPESYATVAAIVFDHQGAGEHKIRLALRQGAAQLQELGPTSVVASHDFPRALPVDAWSRVMMEVEAGGRIRVTVDGSSVIDVAAAPGWPRSGRTLIVTGINFVPRPHQGVRVRVDDVRVDGS